MKHLCYCKSVVNFILPMANVSFTQKSITSSYTQFSNSGLAFCFPPRYGNIIGVRYKIYKMLITGLVIDRANRNVVVPGTAFFLINFCHAVPQELNNSIAILMRNPFNASHPICRGCVLNSIITATAKRELISYELMDVRCRCATWENIQ